MPTQSVITPALLSSVRRQKHLPRDCWYFVVGVTLNALNLSTEIPTVFKHAIENGGGSIDVKPGHGERLEIARKMREALIKAAAITGLPKVCDGLYANHVRSNKMCSEYKLLDSPQAAYFCRASR